MNNAHIEIETISAFADGEVGGSERARIAAHLSSCPSCAASLRRIQSASESLAALGPVELTIDEHRKLRQAVLGAAKTRAEGRWSFGRLQWSVAGAFALVAVAVVGFTFLQSVPRQTDAESVTEAMAPAEAPGPVEIGSEDEIRSRVLALPAVQERIRRTTEETTLQAPAAAPPAGNDAARDRGAAGVVEDTGEAEAFATGSDDDAGPDGDGGAGAAGGTGAYSAAPEAGSAKSEEAGAACLAALPATRTEPLEPIVAEEVVFEGTPAWLLVYSTSPGSQAPKELKTFVVERDACATKTGEKLREAILASSSFPPS